MMVEQHEMMRPQYCEVKSFDDSATLPPPLDPLDEHAKTSAANAVAAIPDLRAMM
jgi:hypothetical protein